MDFINLLYVGLLSQITHIIWSIPFLILRIFRTNLYHITNTSEQTEILNKFNTYGFSSYFYDGKPAGFIFSWWFIALVRYEESDWRSPKRHIMLFTYPKGLNFLKTQSKVEIQSVSDDELKPQYLECGTNPYNNQWTKRSLDLDYLEPNSDQQIVIDEIIENFNKSKSKTYVSYLYGPRGTGKTSVGLFIAKQLNGFYTDNFHPSKPGFTISNLYSYVTPNSKQPLIISIDEFDILLENIHNETIREHKEIRIEVMNKRDWNKLLDNLPMFYQNVIIILSSNKSPEEINELDPSYIRYPRVNKIYHMPNSIFSTFSTSTYDLSVKVKKVRSRITYESEEDE